MEKRDMRDDFLISRSQISDQYATTPETAAAGLVAAAVFGRPVLGPGGGLCVLKSGVLT
ncbi:MAG: hypothetical protein V3Q69_11355 [Burkholderia sp.]